MRGSWSGVIFVLENRKLAKCIQRNLMSEEPSELKTSTLSEGASWWLRQQRICLKYGRLGFNPWVGKIPWNRKWQPTPVFLPGESHGWRSLIGYSPWGHKELDMTETTCLSEGIIQILCTDLEVKSLINFTSG